MANKKDPRNDADSRRTATEKEGGLSENHDVVNARKALSSIPSVSSGLETVSPTTFRPVSRKRRHRTFHSKGKHSANTGKSSHSPWGPSLKPTSELGNSSLASEEKPQTSPEERFLAMSDTKTPASSTHSGKYWRDLDLTQKKTAMSHILAEYGRKAFPNQIDYQPLAVSTEKRPRTIEYYQSDDFIDSCHKIFVTEIGSLPRMLLYPDIETPEFEAFAYHILVAFPAIMDNIRRYDGTLPNEILGKILGVASTKQGGKIRHKARNCGVQTGAEGVDVDHGPRDSPTPELAVPATVDHRLITEIVREHQRRHSLQVAKSEEHVFGSALAHGNAMSELENIDETFGTRSVIRQPLPHIFDDDDPWYTKTRKVLFYCVRNFSRMVARGFSDVIEVPRTMIAARLKAPVTKSEEQLMYESRKRGAERKQLQRMAAAERADVSQKEYEETYAFIRVVTAGLWSNMKDWWRRTMTSRISVDDALQNDFLPLPWKIRVIEDCLYYIRTICKLPGPNLDYPKWLAEFSDVFYIMHEYGKISYETTRFVQHKIVDYEDNLHYYRILYELTVPLDERTEWNFLDWKTSLFVMSDPVDDFGRMNMLPLQHLLFFGRYYPSYLTQMLRHALHPTLGFPFGLAASQVTNLLKDLLDDDSLKTHFYNLRPNRHFLAHYFALWSSVVDRPTVQNLWSKPADKAVIAEACFIPGQAKRDLGIAFWNFDKMWRLYHGGQEESSESSMKVRYAPLFSPPPNGRMPELWNSSDKTGRDEMHVQSVDKPLPPNLEAKWKRSWILRKYLHVGKIEVDAHSVRKAFARLKEEMNDFIWPSEESDIRFPFAGKIMALTGLSPVDTKYFPWLHDPEEAFNILHDHFLLNTFRQLTSKIQLESALDYSVGTVHDAFISSGNMYGKSPSHRFLQKAVFTLSFRFKVAHENCISSLAAEMTALRLNEAALRANLRPSESIFLREENSSPALQLSLEETVNSVENEKMRELAHLSVFRNEVIQAKEREKQIREGREPLLDYYTRRGPVFVGLPYLNALDFEDYISLSKPWHNVDSDALPESLRWLEQMDWKESYAGKQKWKLTRKKVRRILDAQCQDAKNIEIMETRRSLLDQFLETIAYQNQANGPITRKLGNPVVHHPVSKWFAVKFVPFKCIIESSLLSFLGDPFSSSRFHYGPFHHYFTVNDEFYPWLHVEEVDKRKKAKALVEKEQHRLQLCKEGRRTARKKTEPPPRSARETGAALKGSKGVFEDEFALRWKVKFGSDFTRHITTRKGLLHQKIQKLSI